MEPFVARSTFGRVALLLVISSGFVLLGLWIVGLFGPVPRPGREWVGWASILFFGACGLTALRWLFDLGEEIVVDARGIYWRRWSRAVIPWSEIVAARSLSIRRQNLLSLELADPSRFPPKGLAGRLAGANRGLGFGDIVITVSGTDRSFAALVEAVERHSAGAVRVDA